MNIDLDLDLDYNEDEFDSYVCPSCGGYVDEYGNCYCDDFERDSERFSAAEMAMLRS